MVSRKRRIMDNNGMKNSDRKKNATVHRLRTPKTAAQRAKFYQERKKNAAVQRLKMSKSAAQCAKEYRYHKKNALPSQSSTSESSTQRNEKLKKKADNKCTNNSNEESDDDEHNIQAPIPSGSTGSSIKVTLKKTRSCSSSSRESTQSFEVVRSIPPASESVSGEEDEGDPKDSESSKTLDETKSDNTVENEKEFEAESNDGNTSGDDDDIEILSDDSDIEMEKSISVLPIKNEIKPSIKNTVIDLKTEEGTQNSAEVKKEECRVKVKTLKEELIKEATLEGETVDLKDDYIGGEQVSKIKNGVEKTESKEIVKEQKFKVNVRSFDDLAAPRAVNLINMPPPGIDPSPNFASQNGAPYPPQYINLSCNVCGIAFESSELLNEHKVTLKHFKCSFKECETIVISSQQEFLDHQRLIHNIMPSPVQQLAHQVQRIPTIGFDQQLQSGVPPLPENLPPPTAVPNMYTQTLRMPSQPVPMQRPMRPLIRQSMPQIVSSRGRGVSRGRSASVASGMMRGTLKRTSPMPIRNAPPVKRNIHERMPYRISVNNPAPIVKSLSESLTKSLTTNKSSVTQKEVVSLLGKRGLTISTVDSVNNISLPAGLSLNSAVSIIPTSPNKNLDTVDLTGPDKPRNSMYYPCTHCTKTFLSIESLNEHTNNVHKSKLPFKCSMCGAGYPTSTGLNQHKQTYHKSELSNQYMIPVVDFKRPATIARLKSMGITTFFPVSNLNNDGGEYGIPIVNTLHSGTIESMGATKYLSFGALKKL